MIKGAFGHGNGLTLAPRTPIVIAVDCIHGTRDLVMIVHDTLELVVDNIDAARGGDERKPPAGL